MNGLTVSCSCPLLFHVFTYVQMFITSALSKRYSSEMSSLIVLMDMILRWKLYSCLVSHKTFWTTFLNPSACLKETSFLSSQAFSDLLITNCGHSRSSRKDKKDNDCKFLSVFHFPVLLTKLPSAGKISSNMKKGRMSQTQSNYLNVLFFSSSMEVNFTFLPFLCQILHVLASTAFYRNRMAE